MTWIQTLANLPPAAATITTLLENVLPRRIQVVSDAHTELKWLRDNSPALLCSFFACLDVQCLVNEVFTYNAFRLFLRCTLVALSLFEDQMTGA
jgi:hypothetical protein